MSQSPEFLLDRPGKVDVLSDVLRAMRLEHTAVARIEGKAPWLLSMDSAPAFSFIVVSRGGVQVALDDHAAPAITMSSGDVAILPRGGAHKIRDLSGKRVAAHHTHLGACSEASGHRTLRLGTGDGPASELVLGAFRFAEPMTHPLLEGLPRLLHLRADDPAAAPWLTPTVLLLVSESAAAAQGSSLVLERLAEVLLVQGLRLQASQKVCPSHGMRALADPVVGSALQRIHADPGNDWQVATLAAAVGVSRSAFAVRFHELVGEPPLRYLTRWRVNRAAEMLRGGHDSIATVASRLGYDSEAAFHRAFKRWQGVGPGAYRKKSAAA